MDRQNPSHSDPVIPHPPLEAYYEDADQRRDWVDRMFDKTAHHYDWINSVMSFGSGIWYRREALKRVGVGPGATVLDVCTGTGLVARPAVELAGRTGSVMGFDASLGMLCAAQRSLAIPLLQGYVERLPFSGESVDFVTMGYALRHVADLNTPFNEFFRVLRPGGRLLILEATRPTSKWRYWMVRIYLRRIVPLIARLGGRDASTIMRYFWDTIDNCVPPDAILDSLKRAGFTNVERREIFGLFSEYDAEKPNT